MNKRSLLAIVMLTSSSALAVPPNAQDCLKIFGSKDRLLTFKKNDFSSPSMLFVATWLTMRHCLASPDADIRDGVAYEAYFHWLREGDVSPRLKEDLFEQLLADVKNRVNNVEGVYLPFAVLVLSEVIRADRVSPYLSDKQRTHVSQVVADYMTSITDYRGYSQDDGWRHNIAHTSDVMLQIILNDAFSIQDKAHLVNALTTQIAPTDHFYRYGEPKRLARVVVYAMLQQTEQAKDWVEWTMSLAEPTPFSDWEDTYRTQEGLAKRHNTTMFLRALLAYTHQSEQLTQYQPSIIKALTQIQ